MKKDVGDDSHGDAFGDGVHERHCEDRDVSGDRLKRIFPADFDDLLHHQETDDDQGRSRREGRDGKEEGREEQSQDKQSAGGDGGQACASAFCDTCRGLNESSDSGGTQAGTCCGSDCVCEQRAADVGELSFLIQHVGSGSTSDQGSQCIEKVDEQESEDNGEEVQAQDAGEVQLHESGSQRCRSGEYAAGDQAVEAGFRIGHIQAYQLADDAKNPCHNDTDQDVAADILDDKESGQDHADQCQKNSDTLGIEGSAAQ